MKLFQTIALAAALAVSALSPALAETTGSHGWSRAELTLRSGPGAAYDVTGAIPGEVAIRIVRCQVNWCVVDGEGQRGWTSRELVSFGLNPHSPLFVIAPDHPDAGPGLVCFYEGTSYSGASLCGKPGQVFNDLALYGYDNRFRSVEVIGSVNAAACRDRSFQSYCERIVESQPVLNQFLASNLSSFRVYGGGTTRPLDTSSPISSERGGDGDEQ
ncbi:Uncharacterized conserved protein YraI [Devosia crocina]|uniref:Uncharacterized conserved protein YraI n=1 Tax=Devosia crocina TaxID=429728 RepID=A0A1I7N5M6_9HYPH|nr:SH3 domain-containing protein [Devosia crocina]SFV29883.1 Uncharacterized conserved protein YraI [Devosia crocina]